MRDNKFIVSYEVKGTEMKKLAFFVFACLLYSSTVYACGCQQQCDCGCGAETECNCGK